MRRMYGLSFRYGVGSQSPLWRSVWINLSQSIILYYTKLTEENGF